MIDTRETRVIKRKGILPDKRLFVVVAMIVIALALLSFALWLTEHKVLATAITAFFLFAIQLLWTLGAFAVGCVWSFKQYEAGAELAMRGREMEAQQDVAMVTAMTRVVDAVIKNAPRLAPSAEPPRPTFDRPEEFAPALRRLQQPRLLARDEDD